MEEYSNSIPDIPTDILIHVFCRLPVKTLIRLSCVCKFWKYLILSDRNFIGCHRKESVKKTSRSSSNVIMYSDWTKNGTGIQELSAQRFINADENCLGKSFYLGSFLCLVGCVNGVFCFYQHWTFNLYLWNPALHQFRMLPNSGRGPFNVVAFLYEPTNDDYIVVKIIGDFSQVHIYKLSSNSWSKTKFLNSYHPTGKLVDIKDRVALIRNGALHWLSYEYRGSKTLFLNVYDLVGKRFQEILLSDHLPSEICNNATIGLIKGCISLFDHRKCEVWVMKEYGVENSWTKQFEFPSHIFPIRYLPGTRTSGVFVVNHKFLEDYVVLYNPETTGIQFAHDESILLYDIKTKYFFTDNYVESLDSVFPPVKRTIDETTSVRRTSGRFIAKQEDNAAVLYSQETEENEFETSVSCLRFLKRLFGCSFV